MKDLDEQQVIKMAADLLDILILRSLVDRAMTQRGSSSERIDQIARARDLLIELQQVVVMQ